MDPRDNRPPEPFLDMTLPDRSEPTPAPAATPLPAATSIKPVGLAPKWRVGDRVLAPWEPMFLYAGVIDEINGAQASIRFDDGDMGWVMVSQIRPLDVPVRQKVLSRRKMGNSFFPGEIRSVSGDEVCVDFEDGSSEWTTVAALRFPCQATGEGAQPITVASHLGFLKTLQRGQRVWAPWKADALLVGRVDEFNETEAHIHFETGDHGWVRLVQLYEYTPMPGLRVLGNWKMGGHYYPGVVTEIRGDGLHIQYDDGDKEWTSHAALLLPIQPNGPDARPTKTAWRIPWGTIAWVGFMVVLFSTRACR